MQSKNCVLLGCGILQREINFLIKKNNWLLDTDFIDSSLHVKFEKLAQELQTGFLRNKDHEVVVFYGCCHPRIENILEEQNTFRTNGQNCVEMLLGREKFMEELANGAFFLIEDWAFRWDDVIGNTFGNRPDVVREIFQLSNKSLLCLRTPCSGNFKIAADEVSEKIGLPVRWLDVELDHLEKVLWQALGRNLIMQGVE